MTSQYQSANLRCALIFKARGFKMRVNIQLFIAFQITISPRTGPALQYNTIQYNTIQYNTIQYNTIQYNTIQYNTIQYKRLTRVRTKERPTVYHDLTWQNFEIWTLESHFNTVLNCVYEDCLTIRIMSVIIQNRLKTKRSESTPRESSFHTLATRW
jgi:hypothetical protein